MGYSITWCAVRHAAADQLLSHLGLSATGQVESEPESRFSTASLSTGWRVIWSNTYACPVLTKGLASFPAEHELLLCQVEEHVMASSVELWLGGRRRWWVSHEGENGPKGLDTEGPLPDCFASIREDMESAQRADGGDDAEVDYLFEIPLKVAQTLVGFKHDEPYESVVEGGFSILSNGEGRKQGFLSRLFGR
jgi:hypothetical protein